MLESQAVKVIPGTEGVEGNFGFRIELVNCERGTMNGERIRARMEGMEGWEPQSSTLPTFHLDAVFELFPFRSLWVRGKCVSIDT
jgi:hypothetical protein